MSLVLALQIKGKDGSYVTPSGAMNVTWLDELNFKIISTPSDYKLSLMRMFVQTGD